jgi:hypothetical protein
MTINTRRLSRRIRAQLLLRRQLAAARRGVDPSDVRFPVPEPTMWDALGWDWGE